MTALVFLVRHAAHFDLGRRLTGRGNGNLTETGRRQAVCLAERLSSEALASVHSSPCKRARETATAIAVRSGVPVQIALALDEIDFGTWEGASFDDLEGDVGWQQWNRARGTSCPPHGERMTAAVERIVTYIETIAERYAEAHIALVTHGDLIRGAIAHYLGLPIDHIFRFEIDPASVSRLRVGGSDAQVLSINERVA